MVEFPICLGTYKWLDNFPRTVNWLLRNVTAFFCKSALETHPRIIKYRELL